MSKEKQELLFESLKGIKDTWVDFSVNSFNPQSRITWADSNEAYKLLQEKLKSEDDLNAISIIQNELVEAVIYRIMELIDGYSDLKYSVDLIDKDTKKSLREVGELHDGFMNYLYEHEGKNTK
ncbi:histidine kinase [Paenibacillus sp. sptzw28]|uniref:histidine kinase n=1 Tax=Paenibacillus sp. sptzw28 TaxID=715179 RepID=UPI001C6F3C7A|nr:histidine kinase [Paenibacillus sp. sptzw28]QYR22716.1 histidine kinase [Paenibacillus sp. sptzw28]